MVTVRDQAAGALVTRLVSFIEQNRLPGGAAGVVCGDELAWSARSRWFEPTCAHQAKQPGDRPASRPLSD
jgi:hypothetical protein